MGIDLFFKCDRCGNKFTIIDIFVTSNDVKICRNCYHKVSDDNRLKNSDNNKFEYTKPNPFEPIDFDDE